MVMLPTMGGLGLHDVGRDLNKNINIEEKCNVMDTCRMRLRHYLVVGDEDEDEG